MKYPSIQVEFVASSRALVITVNPDDYSGTRNPTCDQLYDDLCAAVDDALDRGEVRLGRGETLDEFSTVVVDLSLALAGGEAFMATLERARWYVISRKRAFLVCGHHDGLAACGADSPVHVTVTDRDTVLKSLAERLPPGVGASFSSQPTVRFAI